VLFCDLVGSTEIATRLDPEEWRETIARYHAAASEAVSRFGGHVAKYLGDGIMAYFGWPAAHDNDAELAGRASLAMLDVISKLNQQSGTGFSLSSPMRLSARVGIDSGTVVVGAGAGQEAEVFGDVPNIAARVQSAAEPDTVLITAAAHRLISGLFIVENAGAPDLKGVPAPIELFRVIRPTGVRGRIRSARGLTPFVGREEEVSTLLRRWERTREGEGQMVLVVGEAGIGKSRLVAEFHDRIRETPHIWMESAGEQLFENTPFHAISEMLSQWLELQAPGGAQQSRATSGAKQNEQTSLSPGEQSEPSEGVRDARSEHGAHNQDESATCALEDHQLDRLERTLDSVGLKVDEAAPLVADLLQLQVGARYQGVTFTPDEKRRRLLAVLTGWTLGAVRCSRW
jgi:class 3 adenylate cyclase